MHNNLIEKYGIKNGDIYTTADGSRYMLIVVDNETLAGCDDVIVADYKDGKEVMGSRRRIDAFKLHMVRYCKVLR